jgi:uncharacterized DUF497 family protein
MYDDEFEWDDDKAVENEAKHGISFAFARAIFRDAFGIERLDDRADSRKSASSASAWSMASCCSSLMSKEGSDRG